MTEPRTASGLIVPRGVENERGHGLSGGGWWDFWTEDEDVPELQWPHSIAVYDQMRSDSQVRSTMRAVTLPILQTRWRLDPNGASDEVVTHVSQNLGLPIVGSSDAAVRMPRERERFQFRRHLAEALLATRYGHMPFEQVYRWDEGAGRYFLRKLAPRWPRTLSRFNVASDGGLDSIEQRRLPSQDGRAPLDDIVLPINRLVVYVHEKEGGSWIGQSILRPAYVHWVLKRQAMRAWAVRDDRNSMGVPVYYAGPGETSLKTGLAIARSHRSGETSGAAAPNGASFRLQGVEGQLPDVEKQVRYHDESIARAVLAHVLNLGQASGTGSYALGTSFLDLFMMSLQALAQDFADVATQHVVEDLVDVNFGTTEQAPRVVFDPIGQNPSSIVQAVQQLIAAGAIFPDPDLDAFVRQVVGLPPKAPLPGARTPAGAAEPPAGTPGT
jgi:hypothetical protein